MSTFRFASRGLIPYCLKLSTPLKISRLNWHIGRKRKPGKSTGSKEIFLGGCVHLIIASSCYSSPCMPWFWCRKKEALEADLWLKGTSGSQSPVSRWRSNTTRGWKWANWTTRYRTWGRWRDWRARCFEMGITIYAVVISHWSGMTSCHRAKKSVFLAPCPIWNMTPIKW